MYKKKSYKKKQRLQGKKEPLNEPSSPTEKQIKKKTRFRLGKQFFKLKDILYHKDGFRLFAAHLMKEFAIENLLFFVESSQWLRFLLNKCRQDDIELNVDEKASGIDVEFHKNVPKSRIVHWDGNDDRKVKRLPDVSGDDITATASGQSALTISSGMSTLTSSNGKQPSLHAAQLTVDLNLEDYEVSNAINDPWLMAVKLFQKYIVNGSYFCINISGENRIELYEQFGYDNASVTVDEELREILKERCKNDLDKLFHLYDTARYAVFRLMIYSVSRFENSEVYLANFLPSDSVSK